MSAGSGKRDLLTNEDLARDEVLDLLELADRISDRAPRDLLKAKTLGLIFQDRSLRTRVSFEVAMNQLGGSCIPLTGPSDVYAFEALPETVMDGTAQEHVKDAARTLSRYVDGIGIRAAGRTDDWQKDRRDSMLRAYAEHATVPVINLQSHMYHPCQALADVYTMQKKARSLAGRKLSIVWTQSPEPQSLGAPHSLLLLASRLALDIRVVHPQGFELDEEVMQRARDHCKEGGSVRVIHDLETGLRDATFVYARSWRALKFYDDPDRELLLKRSLDRWIVTSKLLELGDPGWFLHPMPVRRNVSVADDVIDGEKSLIYDQAENRLRTQKALLVHLL